MSDLIRVWKSVGNSLMVAAIRVWLPESFRGIGGRTTDCSLESGSSEIADRNSAGASDYAWFLDSSSSKSVSKELCRSLAGSFIFL